MTFSSGITIPNNTKALIFDLDGTLVDNMPLHIAAWKQSGIEHSIEITDAMILQNTGVPTLPLISMLSDMYGWDIDIASFTSRKQELYRVLKKEQGGVKTIDPIVQIARYYYGKLPMTIGTGSTRINAIGSLEDAGIISLFDIVITADDVTRPKPDPEVFLKGAEHVKVSPEHCIVFEDGDLGIKGAMQAGMQYIDVRKYL